MYNANIKIFLQKIPGFSRIICIFRRWNLEYDMGRSVCAYSGVETWNMIWDALYLHIQALKLGIWYGTLCMSQNVIEFKLNKDQCKDVMQGKLF